MKEKRYLLLLLVVTSSVFSQLKGVVVDENNNPIPFVNIFVQGENIGTISNEIGIFEINTSIDNTLFFTSAGFENKAVKGVETKKVVLLKKIIELEEVIVHNSKQTTVNELDTFDKKKVNFYYGLSLNQWFLAKYFNFNETIKKTPFLKTITINTNSENRTSAIKIRLMLPDNEDNPSEDAVNEDMIVKIKKGKRNTVVDVSKYKIKIDEKGIFVVVEFMFIEENIFLNYKDKLGKRHIVYSPSIGALPTDEHNLWIYNKEWKRFIGKNPYNYEGQEEYFNKSIDLAISLKLTN